MEEYNTKKFEWEDDKTYEKRMSELVKKITEKKEVGRQAPVTKHEGDKWNYTGSYNKTTSPNGKYFFMLPMPLLKYIWNTLGSKCGLKRAIMETLIGVDEGFRVSEKWICGMIGVDNSNKDTMSSYRKARRELCNMGWIKYDEVNNEIIICYDYLWQQVYEKEQQE